MEISTTRFGTVTINNDKIITFKEGIPGFEDQKKFFFFETVQSKPLVWMQSVTSAHVALPVINPFLIKDNYTLDIRDSEVQEMGIGDEGDIMIWIVAVVPPDITKITANLAAPIIVNVKKALGRQLVTDIKEYEPRYPIFEQLVKLLEGAEANAGTVKKG